ncbi:MAG: ABC transporter substrate-binding protein [Rhodospirillales bacterium]|jgi:phospholipid transport system substrate-binding protein|nr:ABC transporter substrate-binding protein [Rhodospirillales bacterium]MDP6882618.1 ABC transporter substrate-binding protein [Rhodospirillales bacterium]
MAKQRSHLAGLFVVALLFTGVQDMARAGSIDEAPGEFIEQLADTAVAALTVDDITRVERVRRFRKLLNDHFDVKTIGRFVLGRYWRKASKDERAEFLSLFEDLIVDTYVDRFAKYSGEDLSVTKTESTRDDDSIVYSSINRPSGGPPIGVAWRLRLRNGSYLIIDVMVEGVSMGQTQRSEFASVIRRNGGEVKGLLAKLRDRN